MSHPFHNPSITDLEPEEIKAQALEAFDHVMQHSNAQFRSRTGQREMADLVAQTFSYPTIGKCDDEPTRAFTVIEAGTGVGKSIAYAAPAIATALLRGTRVMISTATVALQEQLVNKDLPLLNRLMPKPFSYALAKGRGRYVCRYKLNQWITGEAEPDLFAEEEFELLQTSAAQNALASIEVSAKTSAKSHPRKNKNDSKESNKDKDNHANSLKKTDPKSDQESSFAAVSEHQLKFYRQLSTELIEQRWNGDRDNLPVVPSVALWKPIAAEGSSCSAKHCPDYMTCSYFEQRKILAQSQVIVVNHDLLLSTLEGNSLPSVSDCLLILDEAHHIPSVALNQFQQQTDLTQLRWIEELSKRARDTASMLGLDCFAQMVNLGSQLRLWLQNCANQVNLLYRPNNLEEQLRNRRNQNQYIQREPISVSLPLDDLPESFMNAIQTTQTIAGQFLQNLQLISTALRTEMKERPQDAHSLSQHYIQIGALAPKLDSVQSWTQLMLNQSDVPSARWFGFDINPRNDALRILASASPIQAAQTLIPTLWMRARAVVLTSATLTSCGHFDFLLNETGLSFWKNQNEAQNDKSNQNNNQNNNQSELLNEMNLIRTAKTSVNCHVVSSPFDFAKQGQFIVVETADPKQTDAFNLAMSQELMGDLAQVKAGALVLFTSKDQMRVATEQLPDALRSLVLIQNDVPRQILIQRHRARVESGLVSIIFGMQSFGEGLDLPGKLCESVFICKLPFAPPSDPVSSARAQWLRQQGQDPFNELVVPAVSIRLAQWVGRAIRTETDQAHVYCYDRRLTQTMFGQRLLKGLPPFAQLSRNAQGSIEKINAAP